jgi:uncharacterized membrane protein HdeD (DUF308 family)
VREANSVTRPRWVHYGLGGNETRKTATARWRVVAATGVLTAVVAMLMLYSVFSVQLALAVAVGAVLFIVGVGVGMWGRLAVSWMDRHDEW